MKSIHQNESHDYQLSSHVNKKYTDTGKTTKNKKQWKKTLKDIKKKKSADVQGKEKSNGTKEREQLLWWIWLNLETKVYE